MVELVVKFQADSAEEMRDEVKVLLRALQEFCGVEVASEETNNGYKASEDIVDTDVKDEVIVDSDVVDEDINNGYRYDNGDVINSELRDLCGRTAHDDWREITTIEFGIPEGSCYNLGVTGVRTLGQLVELSEKNLLDISSIGPTRAKALKEKLNVVGLQLSEVGLKPAKHDNDSKYDDGSEINDELRKLCDRAHRSNWRNIPLIYFLCILPDDEPAFVRFGRHIEKKRFIHSVNLLRLLRKSF